MSVAQGRFKFEVQRDAQPSGLTSYAGVPLVGETARALGMQQSVQQHLGGAVNSQAYSPWEILDGTTSAIAVGAKSVADASLLGRDLGFLEVTQKLRFPSETTIGRFLQSAHELPRLQAGQAGKAVLPPESRVLRALDAVVQEQVAGDRQPVAGNQ